MAGRILKMPVALISIVDSERLWFKSYFGVDFSETARDFAFCNYTIAEDAPPVFVVPDAHLDERFATRDFVLGPPYARFYAGAPIVVNAMKIGTFCVLDVSPHHPTHFTTQQQALLQEYAALVTDLLLHQKRVMEVARFDVPRLSLAIVQHLQGPLRQLNLLYHDLDQALHRQQQLQQQQQMMMIQDEEEEDKVDGVLARFQSQVQLVQRCLELVLRFAVLLVQGTGYHPVHSPVHHSHHHHSHSNRKRKSPSSPTGSQPWLSLGEFVGEMKRLLAFDQQDESSAQAIATTTRPQQKQQQIIAWHCSNEEEDQVWLSMQQELGGGGGQESRCLRMAAVLGYLLVKHLDLCQVIRLTFSWQQIEAEEEVEGAVIGADNMLQSTVMRRVVEEEDEDEMVGEDGQQLLVGRLVVTIELQGLLLLEGIEEKGSYDLSLAQEIFQGVQGRLEVLSHAAFTQPDQRWLQLSLPWLFSRQPPPPPLPSANPHPTPCASSSSSRLASSSSSASPAAAIAVDVNQPLLRGPTNDAASSSPDHQQQQQEQMQQLQVLSLSSSSSLLTADESSAAVALAASCTTSPLILYNNNETGTGATGAKAAKGTEDDHHLLLLDLPITARHKAKAMKRAHGGGGGGNSSAHSNNSYLNAMNDFFSASTMMMMAAGGSSSKKVLSGAGPEHPVLQEEEKLLEEEEEQQQQQLGSRRRRKPTSSNKGRGR